eukprot:1255272-Prorocentrum_lima.AAC.1
MQRRKWRTTAPQGGASSTPNAGPGLPRCLCRRLRTVSRYLVIADGVAAIELDSEVLAHVGYYREGCEG